LGHDSNGHHKSLEAVSLDVVVIQASGSSFCTSVSFLTVRSDVTGHAVVMLGASLDFYKKKYLLRFLLTALESCGKVAVTEGFCEPYDKSLQQLKKPHKDVGNRKAPKRRRPVCVRKLLVGLFVLWRCVMETRKRSSIEVFVNASDEITLMVGGEDLSISPEDVELVCHWLIDTRNEMGVKGNG
jgi:hypothetical protein